MKEVFDTLIQIKENTGLDIDIYTLSGKTFFSTNDEKPSYKLVSQSAGQFKNGYIIDKDKDITYFLIRRQGSIEPLIGVIMGSNEVSRNYAVIVSSLIEKTLSSEKAILDQKTKFKLLFSGELSKLQYESLKSGYNGKSFNYYVLSIIVKPQSKSAELISFLQTMSESGDIVTATDEKTIVYLKNSENSEYSSANDFAHILYDNIKEELLVEIKINVGGTASNFDDFVPAYQHSLLAYNFGMLLDPASNVYSYKEYTMIKMLSDIPKESLTNYFDTLLDKQSLEILHDEELMSTADIFMKNSLNIAETSRNMFMHRNTLIYRLDKIENATGLNIRHFNDALVFRLISILNKLLNR